MKNTNFFRAFRKRWWVIALFVAIGFVAASVTQPSKIDKLTARKTVAFFHAKNIMLIKTERAIPALDYGRVTLQATTGAVPDEFAQKFKVSRVSEVTTDDPTATGDAATTQGSGNGSGNRVGTNAARKPFAEPGVLRFYSPSTGFVIVTASPDRSNGSFVVEAATGNKATAAAAANLYAKELASYLAQVAQSDYDTALARVQSDQAQSEQTLRTLNAQLAVAGLDPTADITLLKARVANALRAYNTNSLTLAGMSASGPNRLSVTTVEAASPKRESISVAQSGSEPTSGWLRLALGASIGLLLGIALIALMEVIAARVRDVSAIEAAAKLPVVAEIPAVDFDHSNRFKLAVIDSPASVSAEAYRTLRTALLAMWQRHPANAGLVAANPGGLSGNGSDPVVPPLKVLLITSPGPAEGKSVTVANLAAVLAETGRSVIALDADFRRPTLNKYLGCSSSPDLLTLGKDCTRDQVWAALQETKAPGVKLLATTQNQTAPGESVAIVKAVVAIARDLADIVIVDSPPLLLANDSAELATFADGTLLLARSGWTRRGAITASADLLRRVGAQILGIGLIAAERGARYGGYAGYAGYGYGPGGYYSYGSYGTHRKQNTLLVKVVPWRSHRESREEAIDLRVEAERDAAASAVGKRSNVPDPSDDDSWIA